MDCAVLKDSAATYTHGLGLVSEVRGGTSKFYHGDALGTTRAMTGSTGSVTDTRSTDAFGNTFTPGSSGTTPTPFGFAGQHGYQSDPDSALMKVGHRYYDSSTGRFLSRDPIQAGYNWYAYCENDPVNAVDPEGLDGNGNGIVYNKDNKVHYALIQLEKGADYRLTPTPPNTTFPSYPGTPRPPYVFVPTHQDKGYEQDPIPAWPLYDPDPNTPIVLQPGKYVVAVPTNGEKIGGWGIDVEAMWNGHNWINHDNWTFFNRQFGNWDGNGSMHNRGNDTIFSPNPTMNYPSPSDCFKPVNPYDGKPRPK